MRKTVATSPRPTASAAPGWTIAARSQMPRYGIPTLAICARLRGRSILS
jgi:hypothetical protein